MTRIALLMLALCATAASAQPASRVDVDAFHAEAAVQYRKVLANLAARGRLDDDAILVARTRRIAEGLVAAAAQLRPLTAQWSWEVHVTTDPSTGASCMAGGKILVGSAMVGRLALSDGELAMLLGHEMAHALAEHRRETSRITMESDPAQELREAAIAVAQENEADAIGMRLALRAGWPAPSLVGFFDKLAREESAGARSSSHADAATRARAARAIALETGS